MAAEIDLAVLADGRARDRAHVLDRELQTDADGPLELVDSGGELVVADQQRRRLGATGVEPRGIAGKRAVTAPRGPRR